MGLIERFAGPPDAPEAPPQKGLIARFSEPEQPNKRVPDGLGQEFSAGVSMGTDLVQASLYGLGHLIGRELGISSLENVSKEGVERNMLEAQEFAPTVHGLFTDVHDMDTFLRWAVGGLGSVIPSVGAALASGGLTGTLARKSVESGIYKTLHGRINRTLKKKMPPADAAAQATRVLKSPAGLKLLQGHMVNGTLGSELAKEAGRRGLVTGLGVSSGALMTGEAENSLQAAGVDDGTAAALFAGVGGAAFEVVPLLRFMDRLFPGVPRTLSTGFVKDFAKSVGKQHLLEGSTEYAQELLQQAALAYHDPSFDFTDPDNVNQRRNAFAIGALAGTAMGTIAETPSLIAQAIERSAVAAERTGDEVAPETLDFGTPTTDFEPADNTVFEEIRDRVQKKVREVVEPALNSVRDTFAQGIKQVKEALPGFDAIVDDTVSGSVEEATAEFLRQNQAAMEELVAYSNKATEEITKEAEDIEDLRERRAFVALKISQLEEEVSAIAEELLESAAQVLKNAEENIGETGIAGIAIPQEVLDGLEERRSLEADEDAVPPLVGTETEFVFGKYETRGEDAVPLTREAADKKLEKIKEKYPSATESAFEIREVEGGYVVAIADSGQANVLRADEALFDGVKKANKIGRKGDKNPISIQRTGVEGRSLMNVKTLISTGRTLLALSEAPLRQRDYAVSAQDALTEVAAALLDRGLIDAKSVEIIINAREKAKGFRATYDDLADLTEGQQEYINSQVNRRLERELRQKLSDEAYDDLAARGENPDAHAKEVGKDITRIIAAEWESAETKVLRDKILRDELRQHTLNREQGFDETRPEEGTGEESPEAKLFDSVKERKAEGQNSIQSSVSTARAKAKSRELSRVAPVVDLEGAPRKVAKAIEGLVGRLKQLLNPSTKLQVINLKAAERMMAEWFELKAEADKLFDLRAGLPVVSKERDALTKKREKIAAKMKAIFILDARAMPALIEATQAGGAALAFRPADSDGIAPNRGVILIDTTMPAGEITGALLHEVGHAVQWDTWETLTAEEQTKIWEAFVKDVESGKRGTGQKLNTISRGIDADGHPRAAVNVFEFREWAADQFVDWIISKQKVGKPSALKNFFAAIERKIKELYDFVARNPARFMQLNETYAQFLDTVAKRAAANQLYTEPGTDGRSMDVLFNPWLKNLDDTTFDEVGIPPEGGTVTAGIKITQTDKDFWGTSNPVVLDMPGLPKKTLRAVRAVTTKFSDLLGGVNVRIINHKGLENWGKSGQIAKEDLAGVLGELDGSTGFVMKVPQKEGEKRNFFIAVDSGVLDAGETVGVVLHELGHILHEVVWKGLSTAEQKALWDEFVKEVKSGDRASHAYMNFSWLDTDRDVAKTNVKEFKEWMADQLVDWTVNPKAKATEERTALVKFLETLSDLMLDLWDWIKANPGRMGRPSETYAQMMERVAESVRAGTFAIKPKSEQRAADRLFDSDVSADISIGDAAVARRMEHYPAIIERAVLLKTWMQNTARLVFAPSTFVMNEIAERGVDAAKELVRIFNRDKMGKKKERSNYHTRMKKLRGEFFETRYLDITKDLTDAEKHALLTNMRRMDGDPDASPGTLREQQMRKLFDDLHKYMEKAGVPIGHIPNYFPRTFDKTKLTSLSARTAIVAHLMSKGVPQNKAMEFYHTLINEDPDAELDVWQRLLRTDVETPETPETPSFRNLRKRESEDPFWNQFLEQNLDAIVANYVISAAKRGEFNSFLGEYATPGIFRKFKNGIPTRLWDPQKKFKQLIADARNQGATEYDIKMMKDYVAANLGMYGRDTLMNWAAKWNHFAMDRLGADPEQPGNRANRLLVDPRPAGLKARSAMASIIAYTNLRVLLFTVPASLGDLAGPAIRSGSTKRAFTELVDNIKQISSDKSELTEVARALGVVSSALNLHILTEFVDNHHMSPRMRKFNESFFKWTGLNYFTDFSRKYALVVGMNEIQFQADKARTAPKEKQRLRAKQFLGELNLTPAIVDRWVADGQEIHGSSGYDRQGLDAAFDLKVAEALIQFVDEAIMSPNASQRPLLASNPAAMLVFHLKGYIYAIYEVILKRLAHNLRIADSPAELAIAAMPIAILLALTALGLELRELITGQRRTDGMDSWDYTWTLAERSGLLGLGQLGYDFGSAPSEGRSSIVALSGPAIGQLAELIEQPVSQTIPKAIPIVSQLPWLRNALRDVTPL